MICTLTTAGYLRPVFWTLSPCEFKGLEILDPTRRTQLWSPKRGVEIWEKIAGSSKWLMKKNKGDINTGTVDRTWVTPMQSHSKGGRNGYISAGISWGQAWQTTRCSGWLTLRWCGPKWKAPYSRKDAALGRSQVAGLPQRCLLSCHEGLPLLIMWQSPLTCLQHWQRERGSCSEWLILLLLPGLWGRRSWNRFHWI